MFVAALRRDLIGFAGQPVGCPHGLHARGTIFLRHIFMIIIDSEHLLNVGLMGLFDCKHYKSGFLFDKFGYFYPAIRHV